MQQRLESLNPHWAPGPGRAAPDGDADLEDVDYAGLRVPACSRCAGVLKPDVVFFGESVPRARVGEVLRLLAQADALLTVGSSLMVFSGYRFVRDAVRRGQPVAVLNRGRTRADEDADLKVDGDCGEVLAGLVDALARTVRE